jgi:hypothetical protein
LLLAVASQWNEPGSGGDLVRNGYVTPPWAVTSEHREE